jgi:hypothetical protein
VIRPGQPRRAEALRSSSRSSHAGFPQGSAHLRVSACRRSTELSKKMPEELPPRPTRSHPARGPLAIPLFPPAPRRSKRPSRVALVEGFGGGCRRDQRQVIRMTSFVSATSEMLSGRFDEVNDFVIFFPIRFASTCFVASRCRPFSAATRMILPRDWLSSTIWFTDSSC